MSSESPIALGEFTISFPDAAYGELAELIAEAIEIVRSYGIETVTHAFGTDLQGLEDAMWKSMACLGAHFRAKGHASMFLSLKIAVSPTRHGTLESKIESVTKLLK